MKSRCPGGGGSTSAFGPYPKGHESQIWSYGLVNLLIFGTGLGEREREAQPAQG